MRTRAGLAAVMIITMMVSGLAGCGSTTHSTLPPANTEVGPTPSSTSTTSSTPSSSTPATPATTAASSGGWIGGEPKWSGGGEASAGGGVVESVSVGAPAPAPAPLGGVTADTSAATSAAETSASTAGAVTESGSDVNVGAAPLRAGNVDDNADFAAYLEYLARIKNIGVVTRDFDPTGRIVVTVRGTSGLPVAGQGISVSSGGVQIATIRSTADGTARFLPALYGADVAASFDFSADGVTATAPAGGAASLVVSAVGGATAPVAVDVLFLLDATGSMGDEIDRLKATIASVAGRIAAIGTGGGAAPDVRFGMTLYRDLHDTFVTKTFDFTGDIDAFRAAIDNVTAEGGEDYPEAMDEGLADAMSAPSWRDPASTIQLVFLVADAPPQITRSVQTPYPVSVVNAVARGIKIIPIASSESDDQAEAVFRQLAEATGGRFVFLSYGAGGAATGANTDIASTDYEELSLDDLIVRLVTEELASLTGTPITVTPTTVVTPPTNPPGQ